jgi:CRISPR system Cascade subunit CasD
MATFLCFRLHGPLASWGDIAVGERRPSLPHLSRSAVLGLVGGALGIRRDDPERWSELERAVGFASRTDAPGALLVDFHTAQGPGETLLRKEERRAKKAGRAWHRPATRRAEVSYARQELDTLLSSRQYRVDALWTCALWVHPGEVVRWSLAEMTAALKQPYFVPYLGRKCCPIDLPMEPQVVEAENPVAALAGATFSTDAMLSDLSRAGSGRATVQWEGNWPGLTPGQTLRRRDRVLSRVRWQFGEREEHQAPWSGEEGEGNVPQQS